MIKNFEKFDKPKFKVGDYVQYKKKLLKGEDGFDGYWLISDVKTDRNGYYYMIENDTTVTVANDKELIKVPKYKVIANKYNL